MSHSAPPDASSPPSPASEAASLSLRSTPPAARKLPRAVRLGILLAVVLVAALFWRNTPNTRTLTLDLGEHSAQLSAVHLSCVDTQELSSSVQWQFATGAPRELQREVTMTGAELHCDVSLYAAHGSRAFERKVHFLSDQARLPLSNEIAALRAQGNTSAPSR